MRDAGLAHLAGGTRGQAGSSFHRIVKETPMTSGTIVRLYRTCEVIEIPSGRASTLPEGTSVRIMQSRGDSYTVWTDYGQMYRVDGKDADALGLQPGSGEPVAAVDTREFNEQMV